jgi:rRNA maturation endonuclease Nob1
MAILDARQETKRRGSMKILELIAFLRDRRRIKWVLAGILCLTALVLLVEYFALRRGTDTFECNLICLSCKTTKVFDVAGLSAAKCPVCGGKMAFLYKCRECQYKFPYTPKTGSPEEQRCPNCGSMQTHEAIPQTK